MKKSKLELLLCFIGVHRWGLWLGELTWMADTPYTEWHRYCSRPGCGQRQKFSPSHSAHEPPYREQVHNCAKSNGGE